ncbi:MAG TPA: hypothetical protein VKB19_02425 [Pedobacter sp.]|nr:hypothetical protein [Pedobacter sp.]
MNTDNSLQSSKGHNPGSPDEAQQQADKPRANSSAAAGVNNRDEDAADPALPENETSKGFDRDREELETGLDDGDLDNDAPDQLANNDNREL